MQTAVYSIYTHVKWNIKCSISEFKHHELMLKPNNYEYLRSEFPQISLPSQGQSNNLFLLNKTWHNLKGYKVNNIYQYMGISVTQKNMAMINCHDVNIRRLEEWIE
jgi:hypothetical protein